MSESLVVPSALAYLYADTLQDLFASRARLSLSESLPCRHVSVRKTDVATLVLVTACVHWVREGCLDLTVGTRGMLVKSRYVQATRTTKAARRLDGLEALLLASVAVREKDNGVASIVNRLLRKDSVDPWGRVIQEVQRYLLGLGYYSEVQRKGLGKLLGKELVPQCDRIMPLQGHVGQVRDLLSGFRSSETELYGQLWKDVGAGITSRQETPDNDLA